MADLLHFAVNDIYDSIQGEGVMTGHPMVIVRLQGCDVGCPWCDTKETWVKDLTHRVNRIEETLGINEKWTLASATDIVEWIEQHHPTINWILLTGGEPAMHRLKVLVDTFHDHEYRVSLETSGTAAGSLGCEIDWLCVSPKIGMPGGKELIQAVLDSADEIKMPVGRQRDVDRLAELVGTIADPAPVVSLQPLSQSEEATRLCVQTAKEKGWRVSIQVHKLVNLP